MNTIIEKIRAEIERRITDNTFGGKMELIDLLSFLDTLQEKSEKPTIPTVEKLRALIKAQIRREELNFAALGGGGQTMNIGALEWVLKQIDTLQEQPEGIIAQIENYPVIEEPVTAEELRKLDDELHGEQSEKVSRDEQIALSIMAYLDTHIKNDKNLVLRGVTLQDAREWIREQIQTKQPVCKELEEEINNWIGGPDAFCEGVGITPLPKAMEIAERCARHFAQWGENRGKVGPIHEKCSRCPLEDTSEDLENASVNYADEHESDYIGTGEEDDATYWMARKAFKAGANWQKEKDTRDMIMSDCSYFQNCYELGKKDMKEQMMKDYISKETAKKIARGSLGVQDFIRKIDRHTEDKQ